MTSATNGWRMRCPQARHVDNNYLSAKMYALSVSNYQSMDEQERDALTHVLIVMEKLDTLFWLGNKELCADLAKLHQWLDRNYPLDQS